MIRVKCQVVVHTRKSQLNDKLYKVGLSIESTISSFQQGYKWLTSVNMKEYVSIVQFLTAEELFEVTYR